MDNLFPTFMKSIENLIEDEEGGIPGKRLLLLGAMVIILGSLMAKEASAKHSSHKSHGSHGSHSSHSSGSYHRSHTSHNSHTSHANTHGSHSSHNSHTSHSNTAAHSNSLYSAEGDVKYSAPAVSKIPGIAIPPVEVTEETFVLPEINQNIEIPNSTPIASVLPVLGVPTSSYDVKINTDEIHEPSTTEVIK